jgi:hypothetical protein
MVALAPLLLIRPAEEEEIVGHVARQADPHLLAVEDPLAAFSSRRGTRAYDV